MLPPRPPRPAGPAGPARSASVSSLRREGGERKAGGAKARASSRPVRKPSVPPIAPSAPSTASVPGAPSAPSTPSAPASPAGRSRGTPLPAPVPPSPSAVAAREIARLREENRALRQLVEAEPSPWAAALLEELPQESWSVLRVQALQRELGFALQRRSRLEHAVRAGHEGLQRAAGLRAVSAEALQQAMADGAAAAEAEAAAGAERAERAERGRGMQGGARSQSRGRSPSGAGAGAAPSQGPRRAFGTEEVLALEQRIFETVEVLAEAQQPLASRLQRLADVLLRHAKDLGGTGAAGGSGRRRLWRHLQQLPPPAARAANAAETFAPASASVPLAVPPALLSAFRDILEAAFAEPSLQMEAGQAVTELLELVAEWSQLLLEAQEQ
ncbi:unnamed protein product [Effrenium voratum]|nr:unnamed protein product [Effrenium voratum]